jgi:MoxR-like ATPase
MAPSVEAIRKEVEAQSKFVSRLRDQMARVIVGQQYMVDRLLVGLLANGHVLIEGVPGLAKTTAVKTLAQAMNCSFSRIQFTPDLLPADLIGTLVYSPKDGEFSTKQGPIFANIILADEINRAPAKVQSALLEAMQERQVTIGDKTFPLEEPFMVLATQNPIEQEGTYPLPEAQVDRFMLKLRVNYPSKIEEREIMDRVDLLHAPEVRPAVTREEILEAQALVNQIYVDEKAKDYIVSIVQATRHPEAFELNINHLIEYGASPRATIYLQQAARALAFIQGEGNVFPNDVKQVAMDILRHRIIVTYEAEAENMTSEDIIRQILDTVPVP